MPRLFYALSPDEDSREAMASATAEALRLSRGRAVPPANFHVTLAFLGSVAAERIAALVAVAAAIRAADPGHSLRLVFDRIEYWKKAELLCVVARAEPHIAAFEAVAAAIRAADPGHSLRLVFDRIEYWKKAELLCVVARAEPHIAAF